VNLQHPFFVLRTLALTDCGEVFGGMRMEHRDTMPRAGGVTQTLSWATSHLFDVPPTRPFVEQTKAHKSKALCGGSRKASPIEK